ncbi:MAG: DUF3794 domain-containing protein [Clostridiales bacterium]|nr:DUF3794 domain-containing protein [Clostridiales bacterium]MCF8022099.1 DUF3794 domain-containing protein [Clostridiales bacterium]
MNYVYINNEIVEVAGLCDPDSFNLDDNNYWTQISIPETVIIPDEKPDIEQINSINVNADIIRKKVIVTPTSSEPNWEDKSLTGRKLIVEGELKQTVHYTAELPEQSVHSAHFAIPFSAFIVIPLEINGTDTLDVNFQVNVCIEDVFIRDICDRQIFKNITLLLQAVPAPEDC